MTSRLALGGLVFALATVAALVFGGVAIHELNYASSHPYSYGPAKVIAWASGAGAALSVAVGLIGWALVQDSAGPARR
ncbi:MAG TPA: hypothetical protein VGM91_19370 [Conexibacter sp.]|jgi:hypothetical protein